MNFVQEIRNFLNFIQDDRFILDIAAPRESQALFPEQRRLMHEAAVLVRKKQVIPFGTGIALAE
jgi:hypothetical protein